MTNMLGIQVSILVDLFFFLQGHLEYEEIISIFNRSFGESCSGVQLFGTRLGT